MQEFTFDYLPKSVCASHFERDKFSANKKRVGICHVAAKPNMSGALSLTRENNGKVMQQSVGIEWQKLNYSIISMKFTFNLFRR
jgi:hypothetical protein